VQWGHYGAAFAVLNVDPECGRSRKMGNGTNGVQLQLDGCHTMGRNEKKLPTLEPLDTTAPLV